jgi:hypothetical protein
MSRCTVEPESMEETKVEESIISALRTAQSDLSLFELLERLRQLGISNEEIAKAEISRLLAESKLELTAHRCLHLRSNRR